LFERAQDGLKEALTRTTLADLIQQQEKIELTQPKARRN
jgi:DNA-binding IscR family transcriptional regulator